MLAELEVAQRLEQPPRRRDDLRPDPVTGQKDDSPAKVGCGHATRSVELHLDGIGVTVFLLGHGRRALMFSRT
jgi:hypothetical protein